MEFIENVLASFRLTAVVVLAYAVATVFEWLHRRRKRRK